MFYISNSIHQLQFISFLRLGALFILLASIVGSANAQDITRSATDGMTPTGIAPGTPVGSYALSGFDNVNPYNGGLNFSLPLLQLKGRGGAGYTMTLPIEQRWRMVYEHFENNGQSWDLHVPDYNWWTGIKPGYGPGVLQGRGTGDVPQSPCNYVNDTRSRYYHTLTRLTFTTPEGTEIEFRDAATGGTPLAVTNNCQTIGPSRGTVFVSKDGTSATFISDEDIKDNIFADTQDIIYPFGYLMLKDGTRYRIDGGEVTWMRDRNGNLMTFSRSWVNGIRIMTVTDSINRTVTVEHGVTDVSPYGLCDRITYKGFGGADRVIRVSYTSLGNVLRSGYSLQTYAQLFPDPLSGPLNINFNVDVRSAVWLPDGRNYKFYYNSYGELARVELPTGGAYEYDWVAGVQNASSSGVIGGGISMYIYRRIAERRVYADGTTLERKMTFSRPEILDSWQTVSTVGYTDIKQYTSGNSLLTFSRHYYHGSAANSMLGPPIDYSPWKEGREYKTEAFDTNGNVLNRVVNTWQQPVGGSSWPLTQAETSDSAAANDPQITETTTTLVDTNQVAKQTFAYDFYNNRTDVYEYDFGSGSAGSFVRRTHSDYLTTNPVNSADYASTSISVNSVHIRSLPTQQWVSSDTAGNNKVSLTQYEYDNYSTDSLHAPLENRTTISGLCTYLATNNQCTNTNPNDSSNPTAYIKRGNVTKVTSYADAQNATGAISIATQYDIAGNVVKAIDAKGNTSTIDYSDRFGSPDGEARNNSAPTPLNGQSCYAAATSTSNALGYTSYLQVDYYTGKPVDAEDINGTVSTAFYNDALDRQTRVITANNISSLKNQAAIAYDDANHIITVTGDLRSYNDNLLKSQTVYDGLGRTTESRKYEIGSNYVATKQTYDALGREYQSSNPFRPYLSETPVWTTAAYDALSRIVSVTTPDNLVLYKSYSGSQTTITDQAGKKRRGIADALGRTVKVIEDPTGSLNYETTYTFDAANNLRMTTQGNQKRYFYYDSLSRLLRSKNPEQDPNTNLSSFTDSLTNNSQWADAFTYDANGNVLTNTNARNVTATMTYDSLNRPLSRTYSDGTTPAVTLVYDSASVANSKGKLTSVSSGISTSNITGFDELGRVTSSKQTTPGLENCSGANQYCTMNYTYDLTGNLISQTYPSGRVVTNTVDDAGRLSNVKSQELNQPVKNYLSNIAYTSAGAIDRLRLGNGRWESFQYNNRLQVTQISLGASINNKGLLKIDYDYGVSDNNGGIKQQTITVPGMTYPMIQTYTYDELNRVKSATETVNAVQSWKQTFNYDRFGNRTFDMNNTTTPDSGQNQDIVNPDISTTNNRFDAGQGYSYDATGNVTQDPQDQTFIYNADNMQTEVKTTSTSATKARYEYDGGGKRVKKIDYINNQETIFVYNAGGQLVAEYQTNYQAGNTQTSYLTNDHLGSPRVTTDSTGAVVSRHDYMAFGEEINAGVSGRSTSQKYVDDNIRQQYTGYERDDESGLDYAQARYYSSQHGRFTSVDPLMASATIKNPQTFNRYSYALNSPYKFIDPLGLLSVTPGAAQGVVDPYIDGEDGGNSIKHPDQHLRILDDNEIKVGVNPFMLGPKEKKVDKDGKPYEVQTFDLLLTVTDSKGDSVPIDDYDAYNVKDVETNFNEIDAPPKRTGTGFTDSKGIYHMSKEEQQEMLDALELPTLALPKTVPNYNHGNSIVVEQLDRASNNFNNRTINYSVDFSARGKDYNVKFTVTFTGNATGPVVSPMDLKPRK